MTTPVRMSLSEVEGGVLREVADWLVLLQSGEVTDQDRASLQRWRERRAAPEAAWQRAQAVLTAVQQVPPRLGCQMLSTLPSPGRRDVLALLPALPGVWLVARHTPWQEWTADLRAAAGEQKTVTLNDGTCLVLNTAAAVDVLYTVSERRVTVFAGEVFVTTAPDTAATSRPFLVQTDQGALFGGAALTVMNRSRQ